MHVQEIYTREAFFSGFFHNIIQDLFLHIRCLKYWKVQCHLMVLMLFPPKNHVVISKYSSYNIIITLNIPNKATSKSLNIPHKWKRWYIKTDSKLLICWLVLNALMLELFIHQFIITLIFSKQLFHISGIYKQVTKYSIWKHLTSVSVNQEPPPIITKITPAYLSEPYQPPKILSYKHMNDNIAFIFNISSYYINSLAYPDISTWHTKGGPITKIIKHFSLNKHHRGTVERRYKMVN